MVVMDLAQQTPKWAVEVKWSDRIVSDHSEISGLLKFIETNPSSNSFSNCLVTTKTVSGMFSVKNFLFDFNLVQN